MFDLNLTKRHYNTVTDAWNAKLQYHSNKIQDEIFFLEQCYTNVIKLPLEYLASLDRYISEDISNFCVKATTFCSREEITSLQYATNELRNMYYKRFSKQEGMYLIH